MTPHDTFSRSGLCARDALSIDHDVLCEWIGTLLVVVLDVLIYIGILAGVSCDRYHRIHVTRLIKKSLTIPVGSDFIQELLQKS
jgi:hypothetical protein